MVVDRVGTRGNLIRRPQLIVSVIELVRRLVVAVAGENHGLVVVAVLDMGEWFWRLLRLENMIAIVGDDLSAFVFLDGASALGRMATTASVASALGVWAVIFVVRFGPTLAVYMLAAGFALTAAMLALRDRSSLASDVHQLSFRVVARRYSMTSDTGLAGVFLAVDEHSGDAEWVSGSSDAAV